MKKIFLATILGIITLGTINGIKITNFGTDNPNGTRVASEQIPVTNQTGAPIFAGVYVLPALQSNEKEAELFGDLYRIDNNETETMLRPSWNLLQRASKDRLVFFSYNRDNLKSSLVPAEPVRKNKQFIKVGNTENQKFIISADKMKNDIPARKIIRTLTFSNPFPAKTSDFSSKKDIIYYGFYKKLNDKNSLVGTIHAINPDAKDVIAVQLFPNEKSYIYFDLNKENLNSGTFTNQPIALEKETENNFVIYPGFLKDEKFNPDLFGKVLRGATQTEYDKNIKHEIE